MESSGVHHHIRRIGPGGHMCGKVFGRPCKGLSRASQDHNAAVADSRTERHVNAHEAEDYNRFLQQATEDELFTCP